MSHPLERTISNTSTATATDSKPMRYATNPQTQARPFQDPPVNRTGGRLAQNEQNAYPPPGNQPGQRNGAEQGNGVQQQQQQQQQQTQPQGQPQAQAQGSFPWGGPFPSLHLWPLNETFVMKMIHLPPGERVKIGRQTNAKTQPGERNGYFDSKVLSRMHAEVWEHEGKMYIKDVKSSNGTFVNGDRLSAEGVESEPFELKSEDMVEFGIDIISEDNKTIVHHKVSAKAYCVFTVDDAGLSARELTQYYPHDPRTQMGPQRRNGNPGPLQTGQAPGGQALAGNMMSAGGKAQGLNFDHVLHRLQTELQKSKETGGELKDLTGALTDIQDTLSGNLPPSENGSANQYIPPQFRPMPDTGVPDAAMGNTSATIAALQAQLSSTQSILVSHKDRIKSLEQLLGEQQAIKDEVTGIRLQLEESRREYDGLVRAKVEQIEVDRVPGQGDSPPGKREKPVVWADDDAGIEYEGDITDGIMDDFEDSRSTSDGGSRRSKGSSAAPAAAAAAAESDDPSTSVRQEELMAQNNALSARLDALAAELEQALEVSRALQSQHAEATSTVKVLEERVHSLEQDMARRVTEASSAGRAAEDRWEAWKNRFEEGWRKEKEGWELERERLRGVVREWEEASRRAQEEEEERSMNKRIGGDDSVDSDDADEREPSRARSGSRSWPETSVGSDSDEDDDASADIPRVTRRNSHSASPTSLRHETSRRSRRESSSRLDPAIRALRATAGDLPEPPAKSGRGNRTPRMGSPSAADGALEALRNKSGRPKRADTIKGRKRGPPVKADTAAPPDKKVVEALSTDDTPAHVQVAPKDDEKGSDGNNTSTESDETAHGQSRDDITLDDDTATVKPAPAEGQGALLIGHPIPLAVSVAVIAIAGWAYVNRIKE
ncbi:hypothetical protein NCC49_005838 [Naganishia albida]|nr:hypothetical protein NCC49_005838 [Naganishia albida]